jgi:hypothetical protein
MHKMREKLAELRLAVDELPPSREKSLVVTKIDEAEMWAERAHFKAISDEAPARPDPS